MEQGARTQAEEVKVPEKPAVSLKQLYDARKRAQVSPQVLFHKFRLAFGAGVKAKRMDWARVSTVYGDPVADEFFFEGYDGKSWEEAVKRLMGPQKPKPGLVIPEKLVEVAKA